ncbi:hypothetical protein [Sorangium sp. So ce1024]|uniref:hypothetical protein n=1 Tax=Sorangium sp. So ce1024 TaxID=3133327 RepID=UPI003EFCB595
MSDPATNQAPPSASKEAEFRIENLGTGDRLPYAKADLSRACRLGQNYALSFYQIDYQDAINNNREAESRGDVDPVPAITMPVAKVVLDKDGFKFLLREVIELAKRSGIDP